MQLFHAIPKHVSKLSLSKVRAEHLACMLLPYAVHQEKKPIALQGRLSPFPAPLEKNLYRSERDVLPH